MSRIQGATSGIAASAPPPPPSGRGPAGLPPPPGFPGFGLPPVPPPAQANYDIKSAELRAEYVSSTPFLWFANYVRALPHYIDDITRDLGTKTYENMMTDSQINSAIRLLSIKIIEDGIQLDPAKNANSGQTPPKQGLDITSRMIPGQELDDAEADLANEICVWCQRNLDNLDRPLMDVLFEMLMASLAGGNKVAEEVWELRDDHDSGVPRMFLKTLKPKPRNTTAFVVDSHLNLIGLLGIITGQAWTVQAGTFIGDPTKMPNMLPKEKFFILTWGSKDGDPRGSSLLRCCYTAWWLKCQLWGEYGKYLANFASGKYWASTHPSASPLPETDAVGNPVPGGRLVSPEEKLQKVLEQFANGGVMVTAAGAMVNQLQPMGQGNAIFNAALQFLNSQITHGVLCQALATEAAPMQSRAASQAHLTVLDSVIVQERMNLAKAIRSQILYRMVLYNWGREIADRLTPQVRAVQTESRSWARDAGAIATLVSCKYLDPAQYPELDAILGLPPRDPNTFKATIDANLAAIKQQGGAAPPAGVPGAAGGGVPSSPDSIPGGAGGLGTPVGMPDGNVASKAPQASEQQPGQWETGEDYDPWTTPEAMAASQ